tara:strand:+ start:25 stop:351 length:327 start_codon:yes stop_codon:yes gene_type:complete
MGVVKNDNGNNSKINNDTGRVYNCNARFNNSGEFRSSYVRFNDKFCGCGVYVRSYTMNIKQWTRNDLRTWVKNMERAPFFNSKEDNENIKKVKKEIRERTKRGINGNK